MFGYFSGNNAAILAPLEYQIKVTCLKSNSGFDIFNVHITNKMLLNTNNEKNFGCQIVSQIEIVHFSYFYPSQSTVLFFRFNV